MKCKQCGNVLNQGDDVCQNCGGKIHDNMDVEGVKQERGTDERYCANCGNVISKEAAICVKCGVPVGGESPFLKPVTQQNVVVNTGAAVAYITPKDKTAAILLAVFLSGWTWLYTYSKDSVKFWIFIGVGIANFVLSICTLSIWLWVAIPVSLGFHIWAIVDAAARPQSFYSNYPMQ